MDTQCEGTKTARAWFRYEGGEWDNVISRNPPITVKLEPKTPTDSAGKCDGVAYKFQILINHTEYTDYFYTLPGYGDFYTYWGPIGNIRFDNHPERGNGQIYLECRGDDNNPILPFAEYLFTSIGPNYIVKVINLSRLDGLPDNCGGNGTCVFTVSDTKGKLFQKEAEKCPEYRIECDNDCPPGTTKCGDCCLDCASIKSSLNAARQAVQNL
jgi:hypothetical protein